MDSIKPYTGYRPRSMRMARASSSGDSQKSGKRNRLGNRQDRGFWKLAHAHRIDPVRYARLSAKSDALNGVFRRAAQID